MKPSKSYLGKTVKILIDRPLGSRHPRHDYVYPINYGYVPNTVSGDGKELDVYILGIEEPLKEFSGACIAVIHRLDDDDDKLIVAPVNNDFTNSEIEDAIRFQEQWFKHELVR